MAEIAGLLDILREVRDPRDLAQRLHSDAAQPGLKRFLAILEEGIRDAGDDRLGLQNWSRHQIEAVVSVAEVILSATISISVDQADELLVGITKKSLELCLSSLTKFSFGGDDFSLQNDFVQVMEIILVSGSSADHQSTKIGSVSTFLELLPPIIVQASDDLQKGPTYSLKGINNLKEGYFVDRVLKVLSSDSLNPNLVGQFSESTIANITDKLMLVAQHWAVSLKGFPRLLIRCQELLQRPISSEESMNEGNFSMKLSFVQRILKLLRHLIREIPLDAYNEELLCAVARCADAIPPLFKLKLDFLNFHSASNVNNIGSQLLLVLEEFLQFVQSSFLNGVVTQNVRTCIVVALLDILDSSTWRYDSLHSSAKPPLVYWPQVVLYMLKLLNDAKSWVSHEKKFSMETYCCFDSDACSPSCSLGLQNLFLLRNYTCDEYVNFIFPPSKEWVDDLIHLAFFLHSEGEKLKSKFDTPCLIAVRTSNVLESDAGPCHEEEALFGDLFCEASRSVGLTNGFDQPVAVSCTPGSYLLPIQAASELLRFLKVSIFSQEWHYTIFDHACRKVNENHIDYLLLILCCQTCLFEVEKCVLSPSNSNMHVSENCYELLHSFLVCQALSTSTKEHLADKVLQVEGEHIYNSYTLALLAYAFVSPLRGHGSRLIMEIFRRYVDFILKKAENVCSRCPNSNDFFMTLPCSFHLEIILMAFHLSSETEKVALANFVSSSFKMISAPPDGFTTRQLSCWAIVVSRLLLILRHMLLYPRTCPSWLVSRLQWRLRQISSGKSPSHFLHDHIPSWASILVDVLLGDSGKKSVDGNLLSQLIDVTPLSDAIWKEDSSIDCLGLKWSDLSYLFSWVLDFWIDKKAESVEELIIERYVFLLCWGSVLKCNFDDSSLVLPPKLIDINPCMIKSLLNFGLIITGNDGSSFKDINFPEAILNLLQKLHLEMAADKGHALGWNFLRKNAWLCLVLSLFNSGILTCYENYAALGVESFCDQNHKQNRFKHVWTYIIQSKKMGWLLKILISILRTQLQVLQGAFIFAFDQSRLLEETSFPVLLFKHTALKKCEQDFLLQKYGCDSQTLELTYGILSKLEDTVNEDSRFSNGIFWSTLMHGLPSNLDPSSAALLSTVVIVRDILYTLEGCLKIKDAGLCFNIETDVHRELLKIIMDIRYDRIFLCMHEKCDAMFTSLIGKKELVGFHSLFALKQIEEYLAFLNSREAIDPDMHEMLITYVIETIDTLRRDDSKAEIFKFYLGFDEGIPEASKELFREQRGDLLVLINALDECDSETVNLKVFNFFVDLLLSGICPGIKEKLQMKFLVMDMSYLSHWLERRLLGSIVKSSNGDDQAKGSSSVRESTMDFITRLVLQPSNNLSGEFHAQIVGAILMSLDKAFMLYDIHIAKAYFNFIVQILNGKVSMNLLLEKTVELMVKLADREDFLPGLKFLFSFLCSLLGDCGANKKGMERFPSKLSSSNSFGSGSANSKSVTSQKNAEKMVLPSSQEAASVSMECDATSADEDDDDGTSDGELASLDKDDEEDSNSESALASKVCTFTSSGSNFMEQHWYFCYTCDLTVSKGCCSICAKVCHKGHRVVYSRSSRFFCDCGAGGVRGSTCQCLKPRKFTGTSNLPSGGNNNFQPFLPLSEDADDGQDSDSDLDYDAWIDVDNSLKLSISKDFQIELPIILEKLDLEGRVLEICQHLLPTIISHRDSNILKDKKILLGDDKKISYKVDLLQLKKAYKSGSLDLKIKADYPNSKELKPLLSNGSLSKSLLSVSLRGRLAVGEGDKVAIFDVGQLIGQPTITTVTADKTNVKPLSKNIVRFEIVHLVFNPLVENYLAVAGYEDCQILTINPRGEVTDRLAIELALQGAYIRRVEWVPGSQVQLMVITNMFVKIYDLSLDNISPMHYLTLSDGLITDAILIPASMGKVFLLVLSESGSLFRLEVLMEGDAGSKALTDELLVPNRATRSRGLSLYFSTTYRLLFLSYQDGTSLIGRLDANATMFKELSTVYEVEQDGKTSPAGLHHWIELFPGSGIFVCFSNLKSNAAMAVVMGPHELFVQNIRYAAGSAFSLVGAAAYRPLSKDKTHCLALNDDGSLQIYSYNPVGDDASANISVEQTKKLGSTILRNKVYAVSKPEFPLDFFEKTICITADVKLSCDAIKNCDSEGIKQKLGTDDGFLESPSPSGFKIAVSNPNPDIVMVGLRVSVGNTSQIHIPSDITIFQRVIKFDEGLRSWYDIPFTIAESLLADEEFTISVGQTFDGSTLPRVDSLEVYGRAKDEFGWKEKMDVILDMEAHSLGANPVAQGPRKKCRTMQAASIQEKVVADALRLISRIYLLCRPHFSIEVEDANVELNKLKCKNVLETIFQSDKEPLLQSAACHVLQTVFPRREIYYHVKDTMRLLGVVRSFPTLISRIRIGGAVAGWIIKEFTSHMHAVSRIALHRRSNMVAFLEMHGSGVIDGLIQVLWGILDMERPQTQTINNIVIPAVELIYSYAECLALHGTEVSGHSVMPAVALLKKLLFSPYEEVQTCSSLAISSRLLQVPFPKQTMLSADDAVENPGAAQMPSDIGATSGNAQIMIEEDSATPSVQYCCDGCSTVPILRRRWHCNICPDFDLCESCYEVLDADRLPPPHSRDHPMSAIPIEIDSIGLDGNDINFTMDDLNDVGIMQVAVDTSMQNSPSSYHVLETNENVDFSSSVIDHRIITISASKRTVNSLLLRQLLDELRGWMGLTSGMQAIPIMQLFYRLSSAVGGPFMDSLNPENLDLENFVKWFMYEIDISKPFSAQSRSVFGEVSILVFMFFTLMLRNWHQPGSDNSQSKSANVLDSHDRTSLQIQLPCSTPTASDDQEKNEFTSQLIRACSALRQQHFLNYLMDILQQLVPLFKSSSRNFESGSAGSCCGSLLNVRRELPAGNFSPFFSDSYAKAHHNDLFGEYHKLLLENTFRLVYSLVRPDKHEKSTDKDKTCRIGSGKDLKLHGCQDVLCSYISNQHTAFIRRYARRLFLHLCGSKTHYYSVRDSWQFSNEVKRLYKLVSKSGGFQNPMPYDRSVKLVKCLSAMSEVASARPRNWQKYCLKNLDCLPFLIKAIFYFGEESSTQTLKLLNLAFYTGKDLVHSTQKVESGDAGSSSKKSVAQSLDSKKKRKGDDGNENGSDKSFMDMEQVEIFNDKDGSLLKRFIDSFLLEWNSASIRNEAKCALYGIWHHGKPAFKVSMLTALLQKVKLLPMYGQNIVECIELLTWLLGKEPDGTLKQINSEFISSCLTPDVISCLFETLHTQNELLANHPNSRIYNTISGLVEFDGYYLESEPCVACSCPEVPYSRMKLESLKSESKFTDNRIIVKCSGSYTIQTVTMNIHDARKSKSVKVLNLYYNNRSVSDLSELKNNWSLWKRAKSCHLAFNQTELKVEFPIPITACNFMIELDSFYENLQASSLESLQCPRCSRSVTDKHGICSNCHENAYQCRQCRNINYENLDSFLCNECGYSKYGRFEFNFMAKQSFIFDNMENDDDMKKGLAAIEAESENAHRRYQQLMGFKKPLLKLISSIGEHDIDPQQKDTVQQMVVSLPGPSCKINRKIALIGVLYGEKCKAAFDSVSKSVQTLQGLRRVLMTYLSEKSIDDAGFPTRLAVLRSPSNCYGCATTFVTQCMELLQVLSKHSDCKKQLVGAGILSELFLNNIHQGPKTARVQARAVLCAFSEGDADAVAELNSLIQKKVMYCLEHHRSMDIALATREELFLLSEICALVDEHWETRLRVAFQLLFSSIKLGAKHPSISEHVILPCLGIISQACTPPKSDVAEKEQGIGKTTTLQFKNDHTVKSSMSSDSVPVGFKSVSDGPEKKRDGSQKGHDISLLSYSEWERGASYLDFVRRQYKVSQAFKVTSQKFRHDPQKSDYLGLKYGLKWKRHSCKRMAKSDFSTFALGSWVSDLILSACSQSIRSEVCTLISLLCPLDSPRRFQLLNLLMLLLPATLSVGESAAEYFELLFKMISHEDARIFLTARGCLTTMCGLIAQEVCNVNSQERSLNIDISQGFILYKLIELLSKFLEVPNIRVRFMKNELLSQVLEALLVIRGLIVQKTKLISDCNSLLKDLLDGLMLESTGNKRQFIHACISGLQNHVKEKKGRTKLFILEQLCNMICPSKPEALYLLILNKAHTQEEFIRGSMTKNPYSSIEIGPLMRDVKNKICHQLDLLGLLEDDYGMELLVAGNIISLDLSISQVYEQVWKKYHSQSQSKLSSSGVPSSTLISTRDCPPMTVTYRLQGLDGEATEPMIKELEEEREESQDPEVEFAIAGAVRECGGLEVILSMIKNLADDELKSNHEELASVLNLLMYCCKIRENRCALLRLGALGLLLETARRAFSVEAMEPAEGILLIVESLTVEANESDIGITESVLTVTIGESGVGEQAKKIVLMFLERLSLKKTNKQQQNNEMVARILPYLTYGEPAAMEAVVQHFDPCLQDWSEFDRLQKEYEDNPRVENVALHAANLRSDVENFVRVSESLKTSSCGERLKDIILEKGITKVAVQYLQECFEVAGQAGYKSSSEWKDGLKRPSIPLILSMLRGLSKGHFPTQRCIDEGGILPLLHALEGVTGENEIGARAENLLDTLADKDNTGNGFLRDKVHGLRHATKDEMRRLALKKREELLQGLGMRQVFASDGGERIVLSRPAIEGLEDVEEEEDGVACMVCREGYNLRPNDMLGVYSYIKRVNLGGISSGSGRGDCVYTTVSHFNIIHFQCHQEAKRADAALKNPKKEWEGATLRNNGTLCNSIFPIKGPLVPLAQYVRCVDQYWDNLNALGRADGSRLRLLTYDIVLMLARFATGACFSTDSKGGGRESNARFLPFMIQMASHLLDQGTSNQQQRHAVAKSVTTYLSSSSATPASSVRLPSSPSPTRSPSGSSDETVQFMMVSSLLCDSYEDWCQYRPAFLQRGIYHTYMQQKHGRSTLRFSDASTFSQTFEGSSTDLNDSAKLFALIQPMLVYTGLIEQLQRFFKLSSKRSSPGPSEGSLESSSGMERWEMVMRDKLVSVKEMVGFSKDLLSWLEDMNAAADLQEAFDIMGALADVLSGGVSKCEDFVRSAITSGSN